MQAADDQTEEPASAQFDQGGRYPLLRGGRPARMPRRVDAAAMACDLLRTRQMAVNGLGGMSKLYFLVPDEQTTRRIVEALKAAGVSEEDVGVIASDRADLEALPDADVSETSDVQPAITQGAAVGGATGLLAGLAATLVPGGFVVGGAALVGMVLAGGAFGAWVSGLIGVSVPNREVAAFEAAIRSGALLMIVNPGDVGRDRVRQIVADQHPEVRFGGEGKVLPPQG
jgi:hypothetical protein